MPFALFRVATLAWRTLPIALASGLALGCPADNIGPLDRRAPSASGTGEKTGGNGSPGVEKSDKGVVPGSIEGSGGATQSPSPGGGASPGPSPPPLTLSPASMTLFAPPPDGQTLLFEPIAQRFQAGGSSGTYYWQSSVPGVARVSADGTVKAGRAGTTIITVTTGTDTATAAVTVENKARLVVKPAGGLPTGAAGMAMVVSDEEGTTLHDGVATADLTVLGGLSVQAEARSETGAVVAAGRWIGLSLLPGVATEIVVPLNRPSLTTVQGGGRGAAVDVMGEALSGWIQGHGSVLYDPPVSATVGGVKALIRVLAPTRAQVFVPLDLQAGSPAKPALVVSIGGVPLAAELHLVKALEILSPPATLSVGQSCNYAAAAADFAGIAVSSVALTWELLGETDDAAPPGILAGTTVTAIATGSAAEKLFQYTSPSGPTATVARSGYGAERRGNRSDTDDTPGKQALPGRDESGSTFGHRRARSPRPAST